MTSPHLRFDTVQVCSYYFCTHIIRRDAEASTSRQHPRPEAEGEDEPKAARQRLAPLEPIPEDEEDPEEDPDEDPDEDPAEDPEEGN